MPNYYQAVTDFRRKLIEDALIESKGNKSEASSALGIHRNTMTRHMEELEVSCKRGSVPTFRRPGKREVLAMQLGLAESTVARLSGNTKEILMRMNPVDREMVWRLGSPHKEHGKSMGRVKKKKPEGMLKLDRMLELAGQCRKA